MATFSKQLLSGSTGGRGILVAATATAGTLIHATGISSSIIDEIHLWAHNDDSVDRTLTIEWGGVTDPNDLIVVTVPAQSGLLLLVDGLVLTGDGAAARNVRAFASAANVVSVHGFVNRIS